MKGDSEQSDTIMGGVSFTLQFEAFPLSHRQQASVELRPRDETASAALAPFRL